MVGRRGTAVAAAVFAVVALVVVTQLKVVLDISQFMLEGGETKLVRVSQRIANSELTRTLIVLIEAPTGERAIEAGRAFEAELRAQPATMDRLASLDGGPPPGFEEALWQLYKPRTLGFVAPSSEAAAEVVSDAGFDAALERLLARLRTPMSTLIARVAPEDPLLVLPRLFERVAGSQQGGLRVVDGRYLSRDGRRSVIFLRTKAAAFNGAAHAPLLSDVRATFRKVDDGSLGLQLGGLHRFAVRVERSIKADIQRVSILSVVGLMLLFVILFRSLRIVLLTLCIVTVGLVVGLAVSLIVFGRVHGLTLAFGASMIGVSIDYSVHFFVHNNLAVDGVTPQGVLRRIWPGLRLGAATTVAGFAGLAGAGLPGLQEVAVFSSAGIVGALSATWIFLPSMVGQRPLKAHSIAHRLSGVLGRAAVRLRAAPAPALWSIPVGVLAIAVWGLPGARWDDDVASLTHLDPALVAEEEAVRAQVAPFEQRRFVVTEGASLESALQANEQVSAALSAAVEAGELEGFRSIAPLLPSASTQRSVIDAVQRADVRTALARAADRHGFTPGAFDPFLAKVERPAPPLTADDLKDSPLAGLADSFRLSLGDGPGLLTYLVGVRDAERLRARLAVIPGALWFDQSDLYRDANRTYRRRTVWGLSVGLIVVLLLVAAQYRRLSLTLAAVGPAALAVLLTVAALGVFGLPLNIVALTALLMVFSMGVDYGVFLAEAEQHSFAELSATLVAVVIAWASTLLGFGLLAMSAHPAMRTIGVTAAIGVSASLLLAPTALALVRRPAGAA